MDDSPTDKLIVRLITALFNIRNGCAFAVHLPASGQALTYERIAEIAAEAINWEQGMSLADIVLRAFDEVDEGQDDSNTEGL